MERFVSSDLNCVPEVSLLGRNSWSPSPRTRVRHHEKRKIPAPQRDSEAPPSMSSEKINREVTAEWQGQAGPGICGDYLRFQSLPHKWRTCDNVGGWAGV